MRLLEKIRRHVFGVPCPSATPHYTVTYASYLLHLPVLVLSAQVECAGVLQARGQDNSLITSFVRHSWTFRRLPQGRTQLIEERSFLRLELPESYYRYNWLVAAKRS